MGATSGEQLEQNLRALEVKLTDADWREVEAAIGLAKPAAAKGAKGAKKAPAKQVAKKR